jgi:hypothetical protein
MKTKKTKTKPRKAQATATKSADRDDATASPAIEAALFKTVNKLIADISSRQDYLPDHKAEEAAYHKSLNWNASEVIKHLIRQEKDIGTLNPESKHVDPNFAKFWRRIRYSALEVITHVSNIDGSLEIVKKQHPQVRKTFTKWQLNNDIRELPEIIERAIEDKAQLFLVIGYCVGLETFRRKVQTNLNLLKGEAVGEAKITLPADSRPPDLLALRGGGSLRTTFER